VNGCHLAISIRLDGIQLVNGWINYKGMAKILSTWEDRKATALPLAAVAAWLGGPHRGPRFPDWVR
jgi:hypothetical protein